jgi:hypothetical protein
MRRALTRHPAQNTDRPRAATLAARHKVASAPVPLNQNPNTTTPLRKGLTASTVFNRGVRNLPI